MIRIAVLGCGRIGVMHAANIAAHPRARLAGVQDINVAAAEKTAAATGAPVFASAAEIFASPDVDAVLIATATYIQIFFLFSCIGHYLITFCYFDMYRWHC